jgi:KDO2-lipid IV(A) lauroyltransferase
MIYWLYRTLAYLPLGVLYPIATVSAWLLHSVFRYRYTIVLGNIERSFPEHSALEHRQMVRRFYESFADTTVEIIAGYQLPQASLNERVKINNPELLEKLSDNYQKSVIVMTLHQGNWEWMLYAANARYPMPSAAVYKRLHDRGANRFSIESRSRFGAAPIEMRDAARDIIKYRRTPRMIFMVADQSPGNRERIHWTTFLNQQTAFFAGAAALARATGFPVAFAECHRLKRGHYAIQVEEITRDPKSLTESDIIERYARLAERAIQRAPTEWLWSNRRWKQRKAQPETDASRPSSD